MARDQNRRREEAPEADAARALRSLMRGSRRSPVRLTARSGDEIVLPASAVEVVAAVLDGLASGASVRVVPKAADLSTQQAADLLGVSRPYLVGLLDGDVIPHYRVGNRRRVRAADVLAYKAAIRERSSAAATALTAQAQDLGLYTT